MTLIFKQTKQLTYILNNHELSKQDLCLLLEMFGFDTCIEMSHGEFCCNTIDSLSQLEEEEFYTVFNRFIAYTPLERDIWAALVRTQRLAVVDNFQSN